LDITVVAPTYQRADRMRRLVAALEAQAHPLDRFEVVIVDNCSTDSTADELAAIVATRPLRLRSLRTDVNRGPARARNLGWRAAAAPLVACTDDDCVPDPGWVAALVAAFHDDERLGVVQGRTRAPAGPREQWTLAREIDGESPWFEGCNLAFRKEALEATGGFDEGFGWYGEDTAAGWKVVDAGWARAFVAGAVVTHDLERRDARWRIKQAWLEGNLVQLAGRHPGLRRSLWRRWAFRAESATLPLAVAGLAGVWVHPLTALLVLPYLRNRRADLLRPAVLARMVAIDATALAGHLRGSVAGRVLVL
jgi:GT2 family glycosyltransferase